MSTPRAYPIAMADPSKRWPENTAGDFFVDRSCIDCDQCREIAPATFGDSSGHARVERQPDSPPLLSRALMALVTCPVGAIGTKAKHDLHPVVDRLPEQLDENVFFCGFASENSFGASSYLIVRPEGNVLMDSPRFAARLVRKIEQLGGVRWMFLSHVDDMADHAKFRRHFQCERIIHRHEVHSSIQDIEQQLEGHDPICLSPDLIAIPTPGHTRGHMVLHYKNRFLFTGDHLWWSPERQTLRASPRYCWYSWKQQIESMQKLLDYPFEWVLPGHGYRHHLSTHDMREHLKNCISWMRQSN